MTDSRNKVNKFSLNIMKNKSRTLFIIVLVFMMISGFYYICNTWNSSLAVKADQILKAGIAMETSLNGKMLKELTGSPQDEGTVAYESIRTSLMKSVGIYEDVKFIYIYALKGDKVYFMVDSEPKTSKDYSPPGQEFTEASFQDKKPFRDGKPLITEPAEDRWGTWVSVLVPMEDYETGEIIAVFGMDYSADSFNNVAKKNTFQAGLVVFFAFLVVIALYIVFNKNRILKQEEEALRESEENYRSIFENTPLGVLRFNEKGIISACNENFVKIIGSSLEVLKGLDINKVPDENMKRALELVLAGETSIYEGEYISVTAKKITPVRGTYAPIFSADKKVSGGVGIFEDISERKKLEAALEKEKNLLETTLISIGDGVISTDNQGTVVFINKEAEQLTGWTQEEAQGRPMELVFHMVEESTRKSCDNPVRKVLETGEAFELANQPLLISKDKVERPIEVTTSPIRDEKGNVTGVVLVFRDFTEKRQKQLEIENLSFRDQLTGVYNRRFYEEELRRLDTERNFPLTIVMGDVNGLKLINDSFGHAMGDDLLKKAAEVIKACCRTDDIISRIGGDEFVLLLPKTYKIEADRIINRMQELLLNEKIGSIDVSVSFGYETKYTGEEKICEIIKKAEDNMYSSKLHESPSMRGKAVGTIIKSLYEKSGREEEHSQRVSRLCERMGRALNLSDAKVKGLRTVGLLHDIGKIAIDERLLNKPGNLNEEEMKEIRRHSEIGYRILSMVNEMSEIADYLLNHHERWDGTGYPRGKKENEIPFESRIIAIADAYDAMTSYRSYRKAMSKEKAAEELRRNAGSQFDPELTSVFIEKVLVLEENNYVVEANQESDSFSGEK